MIKLKNILAFLLVSVLMLPLLGLAKKPALVPSPPQLGANAYVILDYKTNTVLAEKNADEKLDPASLTKMMTVYVIDKALESGSITLDTEVPISEEAWKTKGSRTFVEVNSTVPVRDLLKGIIIQSGNDASVAMAEFIAGSQDAFADIMNQEAARLGMVNSHFVNPTGLPSTDHYTTAKDMAILAHATIKDFPESYALYSQKWFTYNNIKQPNRNRLLWRDKSVDGIKTGHTDAAGYCLVASAKRNNMRLITVLMGADNDNARTNQSAQLLSYGFRFYETKKLYAKNEVISEPRIWMGSAEKLPVGMNEDLFVTVAKGQYQNLNIQMQLDAVIKAPVDKSETIGKVIIKLHDKVISEQPLIALESVSAGSFWHKLTDYIALKFKMLASNSSSEGAKTT